MGQLEALQAVVAFSFLPQNIQHQADQLCIFNVLPLGPVVPSTTLTQNEAVCPEDLPKVFLAFGVHGNQLQVQKHSVRHVIATGGLVVVHAVVQVAVSVVNVCGRCEARC